MGRCWFGSIGFRQSALGNPLSADRLHDKFENSAGPRADSRRLNAECRRSAAEISPRGMFGFTLIEVTIGIVILATGLTILLGLQSSSIRRAIHDRDQQFAMLLSRAILAGVESGITEATEGDRHGSASEFVKDIQMFNDAAEADQNRLAQFEVEWQVVATDLPVKEKALRRLQLTIRWGKDPADAFSVISFFPGEPDAVPDDPT